MNTAIVPVQQDTTLPPIYKFLRADGSAPSGTGRYTKGRWRNVRGVLVPCQRGLHATTADHLVPHINEALWRVEIGGEYVWHGDPSMGRKLVARRMRVVERIAAWNERTARLFAVECAERVLPIYEREHPNDTRPREALAVARRFADGQATQDERVAASAAARAASAAARAASDASWAASWAAAWAASWAASSAAARAAVDASWAASWAAARAASRAASAASWAASDASWAAASAAARAAASAAEQQWQNRRLAEMLGLEVAS